MSDADRTAAASISRTAAWRRWQMLSFDEPTAEDLPPEPEPDPGPDPEVLRAQWRAEAVEIGHKEGWTEGHAQGLLAGTSAGHQEGLDAGRQAGYAEGLAQAREQGQQEAQHLHALAQSCAASVGALEDKMGQALLTLALDIARQIVRATLEEQPETLIAAVREVLHINPTAAGQMRLWVHPEDLELVRLHLADELKEGRWRVLPDESIARGGCRAETPYGDIDATLQTRWRRVAASMGRNATWEDPA